MRYNIIRRIYYDYGPNEVTHLLDSGVWRLQIEGLRRFKSKGSAEKFIRAHMKLPEYDTVKVDFEIISEDALVRKFYGLSD